MFQVLIVEDSESCQLIATSALAGDNIAVTCASTLKEAVEQFAKKSFDLVLLDLILPDGDGLSLIQEFKNVPVIMTTARGELDNKVKAFGLGVDDYLTKPFHPTELHARVLSRLNKIAAQRKDSDALRIGGVAIDIPLMRTFVRRGQADIPVDLTAKEFKLLTFLAQNQGKVFSRDELVTKIWGTSTHVIGRTVDSHICAIRRKLQPYSRYILSVPGEGYRLMVSTADQSTPAIEMQN